MGRSSFGQRHLRGPSHVSQNLHLLSQHYRKPFRPTKKNQRKPCFDLNDDGSSPLWEYHNRVTTTAMNTRRTSCCCSPSPEILISTSKRTYLNAIAKLSVVYDVAVSHSEEKSVNIGRCKPDPSEGPVGCGQFVGHSEPNMFKLWQPWQSINQSYSASQKHEDEKSASPSIRHGE